MVVQHNMQAMNSNRMLNLTQNSLSKSTEKLASGYRINRAADDAAGLAISEKMRKQIRGIEQASANAQDGISCVQTAEGALAEVEDMLQRMNQLNVQAANGTNSKSDRKAIQDEIDQLVDEIDRISETSKFNEIYLLKGSTEGGKEMVGQSTYVDYNAATISWSNEYGDVYDANGNTVGDIENYIRVNDDGTLTMLQELYIDDNGVKYEIADPDNIATITYTYVENGVTVTVAENQLPVVGIRLNADKQNQYFVETDDGTRQYITDANIEKYMKINGSHDNVLLKNPNEVKVVDATTGLVRPITETEAQGIAKVKNGIPELYDADGKRVSANGLAAIMSQETAIDQLHLKTGQTLREIGMKAPDLQNYVVTTQHAYPQALEIMLQVGSDGTYNNKLPVIIDSMGSVNLGVDILHSKNNGIVDEDGQLATDAIDVIAAAINKVSAQRASLGAIQNRLEHTINNLDNVAENTTAAESQIRDTDMATEMVAYSNTNILAQAGQSMLAQANQANQGVLSLLQG